MKKFALVCSIIITCSSTFAAFPGASDPSEISVPSLPGGMTIGGSALYLQPSPNHGDLDYAYIASRPFITPPLFNEDILSVEPDYAWGWSIENGYIFPNTGNDINFRYFYFNTNDSSASGFLFNGVNEIFPIQPIFGQSFDFTNANAKSNYSINQVDATVGQYVDIGCRVRLHGFAGARWLDLDRGLSSNIFPIGVPFSPTFLSFKEKSEFEGLGPITGLDGSYYLGYGFGLVAHGDAGLLVGNIDATTNVNFVQRSDIENLTTSSGSKQQLTPFWDAKLGADYTFMFHNTYNSSLTLEAGYQISEYYNAIDRLYVNRIVPPDGVSSGPQNYGDAFTNSFIGQRKTSDLALAGPYVDLTLHI